MNNPSIDEFLLQQIHSFDAEVNDLKVEFILWLAYVWGYAL